MKKAGFVLLGLMGIHFVMLSHLRFTAWPEMFSFPYLFRQGFSLYGDMVHVYPPFLTYLLSVVYAVFGNSLNTLQIFSWFVILINDCLLYLVTLKITKSQRLGLLTALLYIPLQLALEGNMLWFDTFMVTPMLASTLFLSKKNYFISFVFWSIAILTKQTALVFAPVYLYFLYQNKSEEKSFIQMVLGLMPLGVFIFYLVMTSKLSWFLNWNFIYPSLYWKNFPGYYQLVISKRDLLILFLLTTPALMGLKTLRKNLYLAMFLFLSFLAFYPRFSFFHLQLFIAFSVISASYVVSKQKYVIAVVLPAVLLVLWLRLPQLKWDWRADARFMDKETVDISNQIKEKTNTNNIYFLNLPSQHYVLVGKLPPKPWVDNYGWYWEVPGFQESALDRWSQNPPTEIVWKEAGDSDWWRPGTYEPKKVTEWIQANYNKTNWLDGGITIWQIKSETP